MPTPALRADAARDNAYGTFGPGGSACRASDEEAPRSACSHGSGSGDGCGAATCKAGADPGPEAPGPGPEARDAVDLKGVAALAGAMLLFAQIPAVFKMLQKADPVLFSPCNVLCGGNIVGMVAMPFVFRNDLNAGLLRVTWRQVCAVLASALLYSALGPLLQLTGLEASTVTTMSVLQRLESVNIVAISSVMEWKQPTLWTTCNCSAIVLIVSLYLATSVATPEAWGGALLVVASGWCFSTSLYITRRTLGGMSIGAVSIARVSFGFFFYHIMAVSLDVELTTLDTIYSFRFWRYMLWYGLIYVVLGQYLWCTALQRCTPSTLAVGMAALFPMQLFWGTVLAGETPNGAGLLLAAAMLPVVASGALEIAMKAKGKPAAGCGCKACDCDTVGLKGI